MKLSINCPICNKRLELVEEIKLGTADSFEPLKRYKCGHMFIEDKITKRKVQYVESIGTGKTARSYQKVGVEHFFDSGMNSLIADQMGIGKTAQGLLAIRNAVEDLTPCLTIVKSSLTYQWLNESRIWFDNNIMSNYIIRNPRDFIPPGFKNYIISMDCFSRMVKFVDKDDKGNYLREEVAIISSNLKLLSIKFLLVDECHSFKNPSSMRSRALVGYIKAAGIKHKLFLSGTPITNRADEYFVTLNLLAPEKFPSLAHFQSKWLIRDGKGKYSQIAPWLVDEFRKEIAPFVIRRENKDVEIDLPDFQRDFQLVEVTNDKMKEIYNKELERLQQISDNSSNPSFMDISESLMTLRRITGMMKVEWAIEEIEEFLESCEGEKIAIGVHHHMVRDALYGMLKQKGHRVLQLSGDDDVTQKEKIKKDFGHPDNRILIISMLAGGVGVDGLQICNNVVVMERQWNSAGEEQFEARFWRQGQLLKVMAKYPLVKGTVDEFFAGMVESKRYIFGKTVGNEWNLMQEPQMWKDLIQQTLQGRLK